MFERLADRFSGFVTTHDLLVILLVLGLTAGVGAGLPQLDMEDQTGIDDSVFTSTEVGKASEYMSANYGDDDNESTALSSVYVRPEDGNALSRERLVETLAYQRTVVEDPAVEGELVDDGAIRGPPNLVGTRLASEDATLAEKQAAIESASDAELRRAIKQSLSDPRVAGKYLPSSYELGSTEAESMRIQFTFDQAGVTQQQEPLPDQDAQQVLYETAQTDPAVFTMGEVTKSEWETAQLTDVFWLVIPPALVLVLVVLTFAYRDLVDVILGFIGVVFSVVWFFGILGWLGIPTGFASIIGPVLIVALSIDFGLHVFMRYREERDANEGVTSPMQRSTASVTVAFVLVALTAGVGFLSNLANPMQFIRAFGIVITLGVFSSVLLFVTLVPALKVRTEKMLEYIGHNRRKAALGTTGLLGRFLTVGVSAAKHGAVVVILLAVLAGAIGMVGITQIERQGFQQDFADEDAWQTELPDPVGWSAHETEYRQNLGYVEDNFQSDDARKRATVMLIRGDVTNATALERVHAGSEAAADSDVTFKQNGEAPARSPLTVMMSQAVEDDDVAATVLATAAENEAFADLVETLSDENDAFARALSDTESNANATAQGDDISAVYDAMYRADPPAAASVLERRDGEYRSMRLIIPVKQGLDVNEREEEMQHVADATEGASTLNVVPVGFATVANAGLGTIADSILTTMLIALGGVAVVLAGVFWLERSSVSLGVVTVVPIALVIGVIFGAMAALDVPLTFLTAFLVSITIGLGIDYNIHISDRFAMELEQSSEPIAALSATVKGTGGALLGSALTSAAAFATLIVHPSPVFQSFGIIVVLALLVSFAASVLVFPSLLLWWARNFHATGSTAQGT